MRKLLLLLVAGLALCLLAAPALGASKKIRQTGQIVGDSQTKVTLRVSINKGRPTKISRFKAQGVATRCTSDPNARFTFSALNPTRIKPNRSFKEVLRDGQGGKLTIAGKVKGHGKRVRGYIKTNKFTDADSPQLGTCKTPRQKYKTAKA